jgi:hypothetical protein
VATIHPIIRPPDVGHEPHNPVRDDARLSEHEDLDREPDGIPHEIIGMTVFFSVVLAMLLAFMFLAGGAARVGGIILALIAVPILVSVLKNKAERDRDHVHPSR